MVVMKHNTEWLIQLLSKNEFIPISDGLGTFIHKTSKGWRICGRDDVMILLNQTIYDDLSFALAVAKSLKRRFLRNQKQTEKL